MPKMISARVPEIPPKKGERSLRNIGGNALFIMIFVSFFFLLSTHLTSPTCCGSEGAGWATEPYKSVEARSLAEDAERVLSKFNRTVLVSIVIAVAVSAICCLRTSSNTKDRRKVGKGRTFSKVQKRRLDSG